MKNLWRLLLLIPLTFVAIACDDEEMDDDNMEPAPTLVEAAEEAGLTTLLDAVGAVDGLSQTLLDAGEITVFAPSNEAFEDALADFGASNLDELVATIGGVANLEIVLGFHVVPAVAFSGDLEDGEQSFNTLAGQNLTVTVSGGNVTVTDALGNTVNVITADVAIENGVVHVIDGVLLPELTEEEVPNLVDAATDAGLTTLLEAVGAVDGLADALLEAEAITVFAPTNDAFDNALEAFGAADLNELVEAIGGIENLETVLGFHVVPAVAFAADLEDGEQSFPTLAGQDITVTSSEEGVTVTDAAGNISNVVTADVEIENGVVHVIDGVLLPELQDPSNILTVAEDEELGTVFKDGNDRALYYFSNDVNGGNNCSGGCADNWPIFYAEETDLPESINPELIGTIEVDGQNQTTYNGWPLYYYVNDEGETTFSGDGVGDVWYAAKPDYSIMVANGQLVGNDDQEYIVNDEGEYVTGSGNTQFYVDFETGRTLYRFINDTGDQSNYGGDAANWPDYVNAIEVLPSTISLDDFSSIADNQNSFRGNPLYFFGSDEERGDTRGVSVPNPGVWPIVNNETEVLEPLPNLVDAATEAGLTTLLNAVGAVDGLADALLGAEEITVFAPTNDAFAEALNAYGVDNLDQLIVELGGVDNLEAVLGFHVVPAVAFAEDLAEGAQTFNTLAEQELTVTRTGSDVTVTDASGNTFNVVTADVAIENGVVHVIDGVLLPEITLPNVVDAATSAGLTTLIDALVAAELDDDVANAEAITVFAPTNEAFVALLEAQEVEDLDGLIAKLGAEAVADVLTFHVVPAVAFSHDLSDGDTFTTLQGEDLTVNITENGGVTVTDVNANTFNVTTADVAIENGVVHVIDGVLLPTL